MAATTPKKDQQEEHSENSLLPDELPSEMGGSWVFPEKSSPRAATDSAGTDASTESRMSEVADESEGGNLV